MTEIIKQKIVSGCKNSFRTFYIAVMHYGVWLLIFLRKEQMQMKLVLAEKPSVGSYRGFQMELSFDSFRNEFDVTMKGAVSHRVALDTDARGNITRLDKCHCRHS